MQLIPGTVNTCPRGKSAAAKLGSETASAKLNSETASAKLDSKTNSRSQTTGG